MKKVLLSITILVLSVTTLTGCGAGKEPITPEEFKEYFSDDYTITEDSDDKTGEQIKVVVAKAHKPQLSDPENQLEIESASRAINKLHSESEFKKNAITLVPMKGMYNHNERIMNTVCSFVNKLPYTICELNGDIHLSFKELDAEIAKMTIEFDEQFIGEIKPNEALLVHLRIPVRGLNTDTDFSNLDFECEFDNVTVLPVEN